MRGIQLFVAAALVALSGTAYAHPKLVSASPANNATVSAPAKIQLRFSEKLVAKFSTADITMAATPSMGAMKMKSTASLGADGRTLTITPSGRLPKGRYNVDWRVTSVDTHRVSGHYAFAVK